MDKPFFFIGDIIKTKINTPISIIHGYQLKKANHVQIQLIKQLLNSFFDTAYNILFNLNSYECEFIPLKDKFNKINYLKNETDWNYWVIEIDIPIDEYEKKDDEIRDNISTIDKSFLLSELNIQLLWGFLHYSINKNSIYLDSFRSYDYRLLNFYKEQGPFIKTKKIINSTTLKEIQALISRINKISKFEENSQIIKSLNDFTKIFEISKKSPFRIIGLFSILEHLITTNPLFSDKSINKQLQSKLNLLNNRFKNKIDIKQHFKVHPEISFEKIIEKLYTYRSDIAHGNNVDFEDKLKELNNHDKVQSFLTVLVKECIKQLLIEPKLINDLRMLNLQVAKVQK